MKLAHLRYIIWQVTMRLARGYFNVLALSASYSEEPVQSPSLIARFSSGFSFLPDGARDVVTFSTSVPLELLSSFLLFASFHISLISHATLHIIMSSGRLRKWLNNQRTILCFFVQSYIAQAVDTSSRKLRNKQSYLLEKFVPCLFSLIQQ